MIYAMPIDLAVNHLRRIVLNEPPFQVENGLWRRYHWPASWIAPCGSLETPIVFAARRPFQVEANHAPIRIHVSADERFELYLDRTLIARGPERGDVNNWFFQTYELANLAAGQHLLTARVWAMGDAAPIAQLSAGPAFLLAAEGAWGEQLSTGVATWEIRRIDGIGIRHNPQVNPDGFAGKKIRVDAQRFPFGFESDCEPSPDWRPAQVRHSASTNIPIERTSMRSLRPAILPDMLRRPIAGLRCCFAEMLDKDADLSTQRVAGVKNDADLAASVQAMLDTSAPLRIDPQTRIRAIIDLGDYYCAYPTLLTSGGAHAEIELAWAESLYVDPARHEKGDRDQILGKLFRGFADAFATDGGSNRRFSTLWWQAGRFLQLHITSPQDHLLLHSLTLEETRYPLDETRLPRTDDAAIAHAVKLSLRSIQMCLHETFMDCPYYEQLAYIGDTRLQALALMTMSDDDRPVRKAIEMFDQSRFASGWTHSRYPSRVAQLIPTFSMVWVGMVHDFLRMRGDKTFVRDRMPGVRAVMDACLAHLDEASGLLRNPAGWNFIDWSAGFEDGVPRCGVDGPSATINWQFVLALKWWGELEADVGEPELRARANRHHAACAAATERAFWNDQRGAWAENLKGDLFSEHAQALAILAGADAAHCHRAVESLATPDASFAAATIYFAHYVLEALVLAGRKEAISARLETWRALESTGLKTLPEQPEPTRSDCHAWGAHLIYHLHQYHQPS